MPLLRENNNWVSNVLDLRIEGAKKALGLGESWQEGFWWRYTREYSQRAQRISWPGLGCYTRQVSRLKVSKRVAGL